MDSVNTVTKGNRDLGQIESEAASTLSSQIYDGSREELCSLYYKEAIELVKLAGPAFLSRLMIFLISFVSTVFCGYMGETELTGVALAIAVINVTCLSIGSGLASGCDTLISQTFGSNNLKRVGVILQRGILILLLACFPCWALLLNTESILLAFKQSPSVASVAQRYVKIFMPALPAVFMHKMQELYLQNQRAGFMDGIVWPQVIAGAVVNVFNILLNISVVWHELGLTGFAAANTISQYLLALFLLVCIHLRDLHKATWDGWSRKCLQEWGVYLRLALPSMFMLCAELWTFDVGGYLPGLISEIEVGAQYVIYKLASITCMFPLGFAVAASVRVGNAIGAGNTDQAKLSAKVSVVCGLLVSCVIAAIVLATRDIIGYIFSTEHENVLRASKVLIVFGSFHLFNTTAVITGGIVRGAGKQAIGSLCNNVGYYLVGFPIGVYLMFFVNMGIMGLWIGFLICVFLQTLSFAILLGAMDWKKASQEALFRAGVQEAETSQKYMTGTEDVSLGSGHLEGDANTDLEALNKGGHTEGVALVTIGEVLTARQLVVRRGVAVFFMLLIFAAGIVLNEMPSDFLRARNNTILN